MGHDVDGRADQYALAARAFHLLTGGAPYDQTHRVAVISAHLTAPPPALSSRRADLSRLDGVVARGLAKGPADPYQTCGQFAEALRAAAGVDSAAELPTQAAATVPVAPQPVQDVDGAAARAPRPRWRRVGLVAAAVVVVGALIAGFALDGQPPIPGYRSRPIVPWTKEASRGE